MKNHSTLVLVLATTLAAISCGTSSDSSLSTDAAFDARATTSTTIGTVSGLVGTCPVLTFALERRIIKTSASTSFDPACADLKNAIRVEVTGAAQSDGSALATRVRLVPATNAPPTPRPPATPSLVNVVGSVAGLGGVCPAVTFTIESRVFKTNASTVFGDGACAALANELRVELAGSVQSDGSILVVKLAVVRASPPPTTNPPLPPRPPTPPAPPPPTTGVIAGVITDLAGTCPVLRINVGGRTVSTSAATIFDGKACGDLKVGSVVEIAVALTSTNAAGLVALKVASRP